MADDMAAERAPQPRGFKKFRGKPSSMPEFLENPLKDTDKLFEEERQRPLKPLPETPNIEKVTGIREGVQVPSPEGQEVELESFTPEALKQAGEGVLTHTPERTTDRRGFLKILAGAAVTLAGAAGVSAVLRNSSDGKTPEATPTTSSGVVKPETPPPNISPTQVEPTVAAKPISELLPFEKGISHDYLGGRIQTYLDRKALDSRKVEYVTKNLINKKVDTSGLEDFYIEGEGNIKSVFEFSKDIQYRKWVREDSGRSVISFELVNKAWENDQDTISDIPVPKLKKLIICKSLSPEQLQIEVTSERYLGMREDKDRLALIDATMAAGSEGFDSQLGPLNTETGIALAGALYIYGDLEKGGSLDVFNKNSEKGKHFYEELSPLAVELRDKYFNPDTFKVKPKY